MAAEHQPIIAIEKASFTYEGASKPALESIDLAVHEGDFLGIIGPSAATISSLSGFWVRANRRLCTA